MDSTVAATTSTGKVISLNDGAVPPESDDLQSLPPFSTLGIRFSKIETIFDMLGGRDGLKGKSTSEVNALYLKPLTLASGLALCDQLSGIEDGGLVAEGNWFISHAWSYQFLDVMEAVSLFMENEYPDQDKREEIIIWFDMFSNSQHSTDKRPFRWWSEVFMNAVKKLRNVLMILHPWDEPVTLTRAWCTFEILACELTKSTFRVSMNKAETERFTSMITKESGIASFHKMLSKVNSMNSKAYMDKDRLAIHNAVENMLTGGFITLDSMVLRVFEKWMLGNLRTQLTKQSDPVSICELQMCIARLLHIQGHLSDALATLLPCHTSINDQSGALWMRLMSLEGSVNRSMGRYEQAEQLFQQCLDIKNRVYGPDHPDTLSSVEEVAIVFQYQGRYEAAEPLLQRVLDTRTNALGPDHSDTLSSVNNLAALHQHQGKYDAAGPLYQRVLKARTDSLGAEHPDTLNCANNLAALYQRQGKYTAAEPLFKQTLDTCARILGPEHPDTLISVNNLAALFQDQGNYEAAEPLFRRVVDASSRTLGCDHPNTLKNVGNLAVLYRLQGKYEAAKPLFEGVLEARTRVLGSEHPDTLTSVNDLAMLFDLQGEYEAAEPLFRQLLDDMARILGLNTLTR
jgi:tetratricopeptide (TPR) repeat protein